MATKINIKNLPLGYQSIITNGRHAIVGDEPIAAKGTDLGFSPVEFVLSGIAMCKVATIRNVARRKGWSIGDADAELTLNIRKGPQGGFVSRVKSAITIEGDISEEQRRTLIDEADNCYVTRLVAGDWEFEPSTASQSVAA